MNEYKYYKIGIKKGNDYVEEQINIRVVFYTDKKIIKEEYEKCGIEYQLSSPFISIECNFNNVDNYISNEEFETIRNNVPIDDICLLDMVYGPMTFCKNYHIRDYNCNGRVKTRAEFLKKVCDIINQYCEIKVAPIFLIQEENLKHEKSIDRMFDIAPWTQNGLEEFLNFYTDGYIYTDYFYDYGQYEFEGLWDQYGNEVFQMLNHVHGPTCLNWDTDRNECGYCGIDYVEIIEDGGYCAGVQNDILNLIKICLFCGPRTLMYVGQRDNIDYRIISDIIDMYGCYYEELKFEMMVEVYNFIQDHSYIFKELGYSLENKELYLKSIYDLKKILKNYEMFERWDRIREKMSSQEIVIGKLSRDDFYRETEPYITDIEISIVKHSEKEYPNYY